MLQSRYCRHVYCEINHETIESPYKSYQSRVFFFLYMIEGCVVLQIISELERKTVQEKERLRKEMEGKIRSRSYAQSAAS